MHAQIKLGRIRGIEIGLHYSWFLIAVLIAFSLAEHFHTINSGWSDTVIWTAALATAVLFFVALLLHELAHSLVAKSRGLTVRAITLFALGGVSQIESEAPSAKVEFWIAIVGPLTSAVLGAGFLLAAAAAGWNGKTEQVSPGVAVLLWLGYINLGLAGFNMIPGYPLDGGRVLRAVLWWISGSMERATRWAARTGQAVALLFILLGLLRFFLGANYAGLWMAFLGWFLLDAARGSYLQTELMAHLRNRRVADLMERDCARVDAWLSLRDLVDEHLLHSSSRCFVVIRDGQTVGLVSAAETRKVPRELWDQTSVQAIMQPLDKLRAVPPDMPAAQAFELLSRENLSQVVVVVNGQMQGIFSLAQVARFLMLHSGVESAAGK